MILKNNVFFFFTKDYMHKHAYILYIHVHARACVFMFENLCVKLLKF